MKYRADIDGLRAVAILSVVLFHADLGLHGGFVGVDVFFVISGFLISSIIFKEIGERRFSLLDFYKRRSLRILPALFTIVFACLIAGWFLFPPFDYTNLAKSGIASIAFYPNFYFYNNSGYFSPAAISQPLLHIWSLGVEEQFYFLAPAFLFLIARCPRWKSGSFAIVFASSLLLSAYMVQADTMFAFYMLPTRAFELMVGMGIALNLFPAIRSQLSSTIASTLGLALIAGACLLFDDSTPFPGFQALVPCMGAALLIHGNANYRNWTSRLLSTAPVVFIGKISYSLYLWHWPVLVFAAYRYGPSLDGAERLGAMLLAAVAATLSYYVVEQPVRKKGVRFGSGAVVVASTIAIVFWLLPLEGIRKFDGVPARLPAAAAAFAAENPVEMDYAHICIAPENKSGGGMNCDVGAPNGAPSFLLFGDSHAGALSSTVTDIALNHGITGHVLFRGGCPPLIGLGNVETNEFDKCVALYGNLDKILEEQSLKTVVLAGRWAPYETGRADSIEGGHEYHFVEGDSDKNRNMFETMLERTVKKLAENQRRVIIVASIPEVNFNVPAEMTKALMQGKDPNLTTQRSDYDKRQKDVMALMSRLDKLDGVEIVYPHKLLCDALECRTSVNGKALYVDDDHLSPTGAAIVAQLFEDALKPQGKPDP